MAELRELFEELGYTDVSTLLNSGNVIFGAPRLTAGTEKRIEDAFAAKFGFTSRITVLSAVELDEIVQGDPLGAEATDPSRFFVTVLNKADHGKKLLPLLEQDWAPEVLRIGARVAYVWCPHGVLESVLSKAVARLLGDAITTRNWATILKLHQAVSPMR